MLSQTILTELQSEERIQEIISQIDTRIKPLKFLSSNFILQKINQKIIQSPCFQCPNKHNL
jgi:hypothetical protein